jgi:DNA helicase-2/ATP-dependent DNA helicase PcrA
MPANLDNLNQAQRAAATHEAGPLLIVAGAGTGKTTVLINRLAYLILDKEVSADEILLLTFTEKSAGELEERADKLLPYGYVDLWIHTFHGFCERILRSHALDIGLNPDFKLLSATDQWVLVRKNLARFDLDYYRPLGNPTKFIHELLKHFSRLKDENIPALEYLQYAEGLKADADGQPDQEAERLRELAGAYQTYNQLLLDEGVLDFGDLIVYALKLFKERPAILKLYREQFKYLMVDEFQDTNWAQYELVKMLAAPHNNLAVVGDDDQAIYKFRGASISNILQFKDDYPKAREIVLNDNYRSRQAILDHAYRFIQHNNPNRLEEKLGLDKKLKAARPLTALTEAPVQSFSLPDETTEAAWVADKIESWAQSGAAWAEMAILVRANDSADIFVKELSRRNIPNQFVSLKGLYYKPIVLDCLAYLRLLDNYHESSSLFRVLNMETFKVAYADLVTINKFARNKVWSLYEAITKAAVIPDLRSETIAHLEFLRQLVEKHSLLVKDWAPSRIFVRFIYDSGLLKTLDRDRDQLIFSYLNQFYRKLKKLEDAAPDLRLKEALEAFNLELEAGESGALAMEADDADTVKVMTVHAAKGLEFNYVCVANLVDKRFPTINRGERLPIPEALVRERLPEGRDLHLEEERRLFYVAATRAREVLCLTGARDCGGARAKKPSRFLEEMGVMPAELDRTSVADLEAEVLLLDQPVSEAEAEALKPHLPGRFSFSQLAAYSTCPLQYKYAFIMKIPAPEEKPSLTFGRVLHNVLYDFLLPLLPGNNRLQASLFVESEEAPVLPSKDRLLEIYNTRWNPDGYANTEEREKYHRKGKKIIETFYEQLSVEALPQILFLEKDFSLRLGEFVLKGKIDRLDRLPDGNVEIIDYKTGTPKDKLEYKDKRQLLLYQLVAEQLFGLKVQILSYYYLENGAKFSFIAKPADLEKLQAEILEEIKAIQALQFSPSPSEMCKFCDFNSICEFRQN